MAHTHTPFIVTSAFLTVLGAVVYVSKWQNQWDTEGETEEKRPQGENTWAANTWASKDESALEQLFDSPLQSPTARESLPEDCSHQLYLAHQVSGVCFTTFCFFSSSTSFTFYLLAFSCSQGNHLFLLLNKESRELQVQSEVTLFPCWVWANDEWGFKLRELSHITSFFF